MHPTDRQLTTVLVVEDNPDVREMLSQALQLHGYKVLETSNGAEALDALKTGRIHVVLTDMRMPVMNGLDFAMRAKGCPEFSHIPIALLSATPLPNSASAAKLFDALLVKPCQMERLLRTIDQLAGAG
ncbi:response regulator [Herbaspirillum sp. WKF16]|jgi:CheY-like chemotaxis protein|uniref:response regulator n=1 Tax=Herbaspirillum sp. WKF16 TaxID=3028312 RepID=UPI0023A96652|nr:response regulator [Herbaspirillum sp. WKF16]WDZ96709.1 response regulator [Herbaspirillum sp. WKF16]